MTTQPAPITQPVIDNNGLPTLPWTLFFNQNYNGDAGQTWTPVVSGLTGVLESVAGRFYRVSQYLVFFRITLTPNGNTSSTSGTTNVNNFPLTFSFDGFNTVVSGATGGAIGMNRASDNLILFPSWTNVSAPLIILGLGEAT
jgi:hypothetical protein